MYRSKKFIFFSASLWIVLQGFGQFKVSDSLVHLSFIKIREFRVSKLEFDKVKVIDNRMDTSRFISIEVSNKGTPLQLQFDTSAAAAIQVYINKIVKGIPRTNHELIISLHRYQLFHRRNFLFSADAYLMDSSGNYVKVYTVDTLYIKNAIDFLTGKGIADFITNINSSINKMKETTNVKKISIHEIQSDKIYNQWANYPVRKESDHGYSHGCLSQLLEIEG